jgi:tight adherence protein C
LMVEGPLLSLFDPAAIRMAAATALTFATVFSLILWISEYFQTRKALKRRINLYLGPAPATAVPSRDERELENYAPLRRQSILSTSELLGEVAHGNAANKCQGSKLRRKLLRAGFFNPSSVFWYRLSQVTLLAATSLGGYFTFGHFFHATSYKYNLLFVIGAGGIGFLLPNRYVAMRRASVFQQCREGFPEFIDLMIVCAEAGFGPRAAFDRISREIAKAYPILGAYCYLSNLEIRAGSTLHDAIFSLSDRIHVEEAAILASLLEQTEKLGTNIVDALRVYSDEMRDRRLARAEEKAYSLPSKMVVPLALFVFPVVLVVIILPAIIRIKLALF